MTVANKKLTYRKPESGGLELKKLATLQDDVERIGRISWSRDGLFLAAPSANNAVRILAWPSFDAVGRLVAGDFPAGLSGVVFSSDGNNVAAHGDDGRLFLWHLPASIVATVLDVQDVLDIEFDPSGTVLTIATRGGGVEFWNVASHERTHQIAGGRHAYIRAFAFHPKGAYLAVLTADELQIWSPSLEVMESVALSTGFSLACSPQGKFLAIGCTDGTVQIRDTSTLKPLRILEGHTDVVDFLQFSPNGRLLATKSNDDTVRFWRADNWQEAARVRVPKNRRDGWPGLAFHPRKPVIAIVRTENAGVDPRERRDCLIDILEYEITPVKINTVDKPISFTSAKIVLVGESNVGKSYLAHRLATGEKPHEGEIRSTHGMKFWSLDPRRLSKNSLAPKGERREIVLWDMGGQEEYRLVHQLFLHDTVVALILVDPTRGSAALKEAETWNKYLDKQLQGKAIKFLVGSKMDAPSDMVDRIGIDRLVRDAGFHGYLECSSIAGRGINELSDAIGKAIDWKALGRTSRPELFQRIRDAVEACRREGRIVLPVGELWQRLDIADDADDDKRAVDAVTGQLATQGLIARSRVSSGEPALVLQVQEIERYAGSLILAARRNERGVPALELRAIAHPSIALPGIAPNERLERQAEQLVLECTVQLMLEHGLCFQHEGLLVFPTLFSPPAPSEEASLPHAISLYYDFAGAIDNTYASLIAWLVLARDFGRVRLWADRAEFETKDHGLCGLRKVTRPGGFAHVDVYFESNTPPGQRQEFVQFVEDHLATHGVEIREHISITCHNCGNQIGEETLRQRIGRGEPDVGCPVCETRHPLQDGATGNRVRDPDASKRIWALRTQVAETRELVTREAVRLLEKMEARSVPQRPIRLLHLSDLHFNVHTSVEARLQWLLDDIQHSSGLGFDELDYLLISGDFTDRGNMEGFDKAYDFVSALTKEFGLSAQRCIFVPGNHDVVDDFTCYRRVKSASGLREGEWVQQGDLTFARDPERYPARLKPFSDMFFHKFLQRPYPFGLDEQGVSIPFWETGLQFLTLNSCWQIDEFHRNRAGVHPEAVARVVREAQTQEAEARSSGVLAKDQPILRIATWHHAVTAPDYKMDSIDFLGNLRKVGVKLALHGDVHDMRREHIAHWHENSLHVLGCGSFGARAEDRPEAIPRLYNVIEIARDLTRATVHTRFQSKPDGPWDGWHQWPDSSNKAGRISSYEIPLR